MFDSKAVPYKGAMHLHQCNENRGEVSKSGVGKGLEWERPKKVPRGGDADLN